MALACPARDMKRMVDTTRMRNVIVSAPTPVEPTCCAPYADLPVSVHALCPKGQKDMPNSSHTRLQLTPIGARAGLTGCRGSAGLGQQTNLLNGGTRRRRQAFCRHDAASEESLLVFFPQQKKQQFDC